ncbi:hypothetical protein B0H10DRAFT_2085905, partial [Mycena sp. CBHHK59/15]
MAIEYFPFDDNPCSNTSLSAFSGFPLCSLVFFLLSSLEPIARLMHPQLCHAVTNMQRKLPPVNMGHFVNEFFDRLVPRSDGGTVLPNWRGDLYLEVCTRLDTFPYGA